MLGRALSAAIALGAAVSAVSAGPVQAGSDNLPLVDIGYALHKGILNVTGDFYAFKNIRFADPPLGEHRFKPPVPVSTVTRTINDGSVGYICPQGFPDWIIERDASQLGIPTSLLRLQLEAAPNQNEDCLFLDVMVPKRLYETKMGRENKASSKGVPVLVWIYGGGYVIGQKDDPAYDPTGLIARSQEHGGEGIVYVALNYRLGMFGWLNAGGDKDVVPNVALQDQRLALEWVKKYVHLFGGDPNRVTVFGESAGGGSIMHHITAEGGERKAPFKRAIVQSAGFQTVVDVPGVWKRTLATASKIAGREITNGAELAALDQKTLFRINNQVVADSPIRTYTFSPTVDGGYVPDLPGVLLLEGKFDPSLDLMLGHTSHEGLAYVEPDVETDAEVGAATTGILKGIPQRNLDYILAELYPPSLRTGLYHSENERGVLLFSEIAFSCNTRYMGTAFRNETWNYRFQVPPGTHAQDIPYTFYNNETNQTVARLAKKMQLYFTNFVQSGSPNGRGSVPKWPVYGKGARLATFGPEGVGTDADETKNRRCAYWQTGAYRY